MLWHNGIILLSLCTCIVGMNHTLNTLKSHLAEIAAVQHAEKPPFALSNDTNTNSKVLQGLIDFETTISNLGSDVSLSPSKILQQILALTEHSSSSGGIEKIFGNVFVLNSAAGQNDTEDLPFVGTRLGFTESKEAAQAGKLVKLIAQFAGPIENKGDVGLNTFYIVKLIEILQNTSGAYSKNKALTDIITTSIDVTTSAENLDNCKYQNGDSEDARITTTSPIKAKEHNNIVAQFKLGIETDFKHGMFDFHSGEKEHEKFAHEIVGKFHDSVSYLGLSENVVYHSLKTLSDSSIRIGNINISNVFDVFVPGWNIVGGDQDDQFILHSPYVSHIDGKNGTDTLKFCPNIIETVNVDLTSEKYKSIEKVIGVSGVPLTVYTACDTELIATQGDSNTTADKVIITNQTCLQKPMQTTVAVSGNTNIEIEKEISGNDSVHILVDGTQQGKLNFSLSVNSTHTENLFLTFFLDGANWHVKLINCTKTSSIVSVKMEESIHGLKTGGSIDLVFHKNLETASWSNNALHFSVQLIGTYLGYSQYRIDTSNCTLQMLYEQDGNGKLNSLSASENAIRPDQSTSTNVNKTKNLYTTLPHFISLANSSVDSLNLGYANEPKSSNDSYNSHNKTANLTCDTKKYFSVENPQIIQVPCSLENISRVWFDKDLETISYTIQGNTEKYSHKMVSSPNMTDLFYPQPNFITVDGFEIKVGRDGSLWVIWGRLPTNETKFDVSALQDLASRLGVTLLIQASENFYFIGHSKLDLVEKRNVLQNMRNVTSNLAGGGAGNTIFEIVGLENNVYLHTRFLEEDYDAWKIERKFFKQTIDLTSVVMTIRKQSQPKFVPSIEADGDSLVITMNGYEEVYPGKLFIVNGTKPWVAERIQLLLSYSLMDIVQLKSSQSNLTNSSGTDNKWTIQPRRLALTDDIKIYSVTPEGLEDNQEIVLDSLKMNANPENYTDIKFQAVQNENDLHLTNLKNVGSLGAKTVIIGGFYEHSNSLSGVRVTLPGLSLVLNGTNIYQVENGTDAALMPVVYSEMHDDVLENVETKHLENLPNIQKQSKHKDDTVIVIVASSGLLFVVGLLCVTLVLRLRKTGIYFVSSGKKACCVP